MLNFSKKSKTKIYIFHLSTKEYCEHSTEQLLCLIMYKYSTCYNKNNTCYNTNNTCYNTNSKMLKYK